MIPLVHCFLLCLFLAASQVAAEPGIPPSLPEILRKEIIPSLRLEKATIHDAVALLQKEWARKHPGISFPVALIVPAQRATSSITLDLKDVPFWVVLNALSNAAGLEVRDAGELILLDTEFPPDFTTKVFPITERALKGLGLKPDGTFLESSRAFERFGIRFNEPACAAYLSPEGDSLTVRQTSKQLQLIPGILHLLAEGFLLERAKQKKPTNH